MKVRKLTASAVAVALVLTSPGYWAAEALASVVGANGAVLAGPGAVGQAGVGITGNVVMSQDGTTLVNPGGAVLGSTLMEAGASDLQVGGTPEGVATAREVAVRLAETPAMQAVQEADGKGNGEVATALDQMYVNAEASEAPGVVAAGQGFEVGTSNLRTASVQTGSMGHYVPAVARIGDAANSAAGSGLITTGLTLAAVGLGLMVVWKLIVPQSVRTIAARWGNIIIGRGQLATKEAEKANVEALAEKHIQDLRAQLPRIKERVESAGKMVRLLKTQIEEEKAKAAKVGQTIDALGSKALVLEGKTDAASVQQLDTINKTMDSLIAQRTAVTEEVAKNEPQYELSRQRYEKAKGDLQDARLTIDQRIAETRSFVNRSKAAEVRKALEDMKDSYKLETGDDAFQRIKDAVQDQEATVETREDVSASDPENLIRDAERMLKKDEAAAEREKIKEQLRQKKAGAQ